MFKKLFRNSVSLKGKDRGFTLIEIVAVVAIMGIITGLLLTTFFSLSNYSSLERDAAEARAHLEEARIYTQGSRQASSYGVRFEDNEMVLFKGESWLERDDELRSYEFNRSTEVSLGGLGGESEIVFRRLFGEPSVSGTITLSGSGRTVEINVLSSGFVE